VHSQPLSPLVSQGLASPRESGLTGRAPSCPQLPKQEVILPDSLRAVPYPCLLSGCLPLRMR
jgi:hypothetical protein